MKYTMYNKSAATVIAKSERIMCHVDGNDVYLTNGYVMYKMPLEVYWDMFFPKLKVQPGDWTMYKKSVAESNNHHLVKMFDDMTSSMVEEDEIYRTSVEFRDSVIGEVLVSAIRVDKKFCVTYVGRFVDSVNPHKMYAKSNITAAVAVDKDGDPFAIILPVRMTDRRAKAIMAYWG